MVRVIKFNHGIHGKTRRFLQRIVIAVAADSVSLTWLATGDAEQQRGGASRPIAISPSGTVLM